MTFNSSVFLVFFVAFVGLFAAARNRTLRKALILAASYVFYGYWNVPLCSLIMFSTLVDFFAAQLIDRSTTLRRRRAWLVLSVIVNLGILGFFKYANFFVDSFVSMAYSFGLDLGGSTAIKIILPIGISFYTFQTMAYTIDVYRGKIPAEKSLLNFAAFISFFPQLVAGPIERAKDLLPQIREGGRLSLQGAAEGLPRILFGLFKKVVIADNIGSMVDAVFSNVSGVHAPALWIATYGFAIQIYCDFSGYCDIAVGVARILGFRLTENFRSPYGATSVRDFWQRWHITLSSWIRDYLYISLGGNRGKFYRRAAVLLLTMSLAGLWHGASWNFVAWGVFHGVLLAGYYAIRTARERRLGFALPDAPRNTLARAASMVLTFNLVCFGWVLFRIPSLGTALNVWGRMLSVWTLFDAETLRQMFFSPTTIELALTLAALAAVILRHMALRDRPGVTLQQRIPAPALGAVYSVMVLMVVVLARLHGPEFIYFQF
jgi:alginate O-acetyltransferase complex protein AlgI